MFVNVFEEIYSKLESNSGSMPPHEDCSNVEEIEYVSQGEYIVTRRALNKQVKKEGLE